MTLRRSIGLRVAITVLGVVMIASACTAGTADPPAPQAEPTDDVPAEPDAGDQADGAPDGPDDPEGADGAEQPVDEEPDRPSPPDEVAPFDDPRELSEVLANAEVALADADTPEADRTVWAWVHQQAYRDLADNPDWVDDVRAEIPEELHTAFDATLRAATELRQLTTPRESLPTAWRILPPPPVEELRGYYEEAEATFGVPWNVLAAIHLVETRFGRIRGDSHAGAQGPMQFMPGTWDAYGEGDVNDPRDAILAAGRYLHASGAPADLPRALFAYNRSDRYVEAILAHAEAMAQHDHYLDVYHRWRVYYRTVDGDVVLEEGYGT